MVERHIKKILDSYSKMFPAVLVSGARQVGKTTLLKNIDIFLSSNYVTFDDPSIVYSAINDPKLFLALHPSPIILDEIQYVPSLLRYIKMVIDQDRHNGMYYITGSQQFSLMKDVSESLAGRIGVLSLYGLSLREINKDSFSSNFLPNRSYILNRNPVVRNSDISSVWSTIFRGFYPEVAVNEVIPSAFYGSYLRTYLERDVRQLSQVGDEMAFLQFLRVVAARTGNLINYADIARCVGVDGKTIKKWISILETSNIIYLLYPYSGNIEKRMIKTPKLYFCDTGLASYLLNFSSPESLLSSSMAGAFFETFCVMEIVKSFANNGVIPPIHFYRDSDGTEIDLLIDVDESIYPIEFKSTTSPNLKDLKNLKVAMSIKDKKIEKGIIICNASEPLALNENAFALPYTYI